jgi:hypothetical protein
MLKYICARRSGLSKIKMYPRTRKQQQELRNKSDIRGYFSLPRGQPPKDRPSQESQELKEAVAIEASKEAIVLSNAPPPSTTVTGKRRGQYRKDYGNDSNYKLFQKAVDREKGEHEDDDSSDCQIFLLHSTLYSIKKQMVGEKIVDPDAVFKPRKSLTTTKNQKDIADIIRFHDKNSNRMTRKEIFAMIAELSSSTSFKKAENHLDYLIQTKKLPAVKNDGWTVKAQRTTTK